jgi:hypothetical protein
MIDEGKRFDRERGNDVGIPDLEEVVAVELFTA